jgi:hypothetical protein
MKIVFLALMIFNIMCASLNFNFALEGEFNNILAVLINVIAAVWVGYLAIR